MYKEIKYVIGIEDIGQIIKKDVISQIRFPGDVNKNYINLVAPPHKILRAVEIKSSKYEAKETDIKVAENLESLYLNVYKKNQKRNENVYIETSCEIMVKTIYHNKQKLILCIELNEDYKDFYKSKVG